MNSTSNGKTRWIISAVLLVVVVAAIGVVMRYFSPPTLAEGRTSTAGFTEVLRHRYPQGISQAQLVADLNANRFKARIDGTNHCEPVPSQDVLNRLEKDYTICPFAHPARTLSFTWFEPIPVCARKLVVGWSTDSGNRVTQLNGRFFRSCF